MNLASSENHTLLHLLLLKRLNKQLDFNFRFSRCIGFRIWPLTLRKHFSFFLWAIFVTDLKLIPTASAALRTARCFLLARGLHEPESIRAEPKRTHYISNPNPTPNPHFSKYRTRTRTRTQTSRTQKWLGPLRGSSKRKFPYWLLKTAWKQKHRLESQT